MRLKSRPPVEHRYFKESKREIQFTRKYSKQDATSILQVIKNKLGKRGYQEGIDYRVEKLYPDRVYLGIPYRHGEMGKVDDVLREVIQEPLTERVVV